MVYPSLVAAVLEAASPLWCARALSVYRFWRNHGYEIGALTAACRSLFRGPPMLKRWDSSKWR